MEKNIEEINQEEAEQAKEYSEFIKTSVADGSYFKDALNWYFFRYVTPICDRTLLIFGAIIACVVLFCLTQMIRSAFPLVEKVPIFVRAKDQSLYFPSLVNLKPTAKQPGYDRLIENVDEAVAKYLISVYVKDREGFDYSKAVVDDVNKKFNRIRAMSSGDQYRNFQLIMSKDNPDSPINKFGQNVVKNVKIDSIIFLRKQQKSFVDKARGFMSNQIPTEVEVRFTATTRTTTEDGASDNIESYLAKISFAFSGANKSKNDRIDFSVNSYKLFKIK